MQIMQRRIFLFLFLGFLSANLFAQTAAKLETMLNIPALRWSDVVSFIMEAADAQDVSVYSDQAAAFRFAAEQKWLPKNAAPDDTVRLKGIALLLMRAFNLKGGIFYSLSKSPHYAYRELAYKNIIRDDPGMPVSGAQLLLIVNRILSMKEEKAVRQ
jgi:hypothetical protein